jgi:TonB family protein
MRSIYDLNQNSSSSGMNLPETSSEIRSAGFLFLSSVIHTVLFGLAIWISLNTEIVQPVKELIEFEISPPVKLAKASESPAPSPVVAKREIIKTAPPETKVTAAPIVTASPIAPAVAKSIAPVAVANDALETSGLDEDDFSSQLSAPVAISDSANWNSKDADSDFEKINSEAAQKTKLAVSSFAEESDVALKQQNARLEQIRKEQSQQDQKMAAAVAAQGEAKARAQSAYADAESKRQGQAAAKLAEEKEQARKAAAALVAAEKAAAAQAAAAERAAQESAARLAAERAEAARLAKERAAAASAVASDGTGGNGKIRKLEDLRQLPGNKKPAYDDDDRLAGRAGDVAFAAYISREGLPADVKIIKSSGHRTLDLKTLQAIKKWRFYPGQEGWVEIPFNWDLKGEAKEMPALLKRKVSQN